MVMTDMEEALCSGACDVGVGGVPSEQEPFLIHCIPRAWNGAEHTVGAS